MALLLIDASNPATEEKDKLEDKKQLKQVWIFLVNYAVTLATFMLIYNASHFHLELVYNVVSVMMTLIVSMGTIAAIVHAYHHQDSSSSDPSPLDGSIFAVCNAAIIAAFYTSIPQEYPHMAAFNLRTTSVAALVISFILPLICSFDFLWKSRFPVKYVALDGLVVIDSFVRTAIVVATMWDITTANRWPEAIST